MIFPRDRSNDGWTPQTGIKAGGKTVAQKPEPKPSSHALSMCDSRRSTKRLQHMLGGAQRQVSTDTAASAAAEQQRTTSSLMQMQRIKRAVGVHTHAPSQSSKRSHHPQPLYPCAAITRPAEKATRTYTSQTYKRTTCASHSASKHCTPKLHALQKVPPSAAPYSCMRCSSSSCCCRFPASKADASGADCSWYSSASPESYPSRCHR